MKFRKKPVVIEAVQYIAAEGLAEVMAFTKELGSKREVDANNGVMVLVIHTLEGDMVANPGDWIIKGISGEFYPCKPDIFEATYEEVAE